MSMRFLVCLLSALGLWILFPAALLAQISAGSWELMRGIKPRQYVCCHTKEPITIDGRGDEQAWRLAAWTEDFRDIEGDRKPAPRFRTRAKMLWDDRNFYVYAELDEPHVWGTITQKNQTMYHDNDFEVFIDPDGDNHNYYEFEMNAQNAIWELSLEKPYRDGGALRNPDNLAGTKTAVHIRGTLNDPRDTDQGWSVEIAFPWKDLQRFAGEAACPPREQDLWRVGFSRVEWLIDIIDGKYRKVAGRPEDNWTWCAQGVVNMHCPERWGFVQFTRRDANEAQFKPDPTWATRELLMEIYHRQRAFHEKHSRYADKLAELGLNAELTNQQLARPLELKLSDKGFIATAAANSAAKPITLHVREDSKLWRESASEAR